MGAFSAKGRFGESPEASVLRAISGVPREDRGGMLPLQSG